MSEEKAPSLRTLQADVAALDPLDFPCDLLIASPPATACSRCEGSGLRPDYSGRRCEVCAGEQEGDQ